MKMRKLFFVLAMAIVAFASCSIEDYDDPPGMEKDTNNVRVTINQGNLTRAFFDNSAVPEAWEKKINTLTILVYSDQTQTLEFRREVLPAEISAGTLRFALPESFSNKPYTFYAVANFPVSVGISSTVSELNQMLDSGIAKYNGTFDEVTSKSQNAAGFAMSAVRSATIDPDNDNNLVFNLERTVAKVAVRTTIDPALQSKYAGGVIVINNATFSELTDWAVVVPSTVMSGQATASLSQLSKKTGGNYDNLFYIFDKEGYDSQILTLTGIFDRDGNLSTTGDQIPVEYVAELGGRRPPTDISFDRNGYYRVEITIAGLSGGSVYTTVRVSDWSDPVNITEWIGS